MATHPQSPSGPYSHRSVYSAHLPEVAQADLGHEAPEAVTHAARTVPAAATGMGGWESQIISPVYVQKYPGYTPAPEGQQLTEVPPHSAPPPISQYEDKSPWSWLTRPRTVLIMGALIILLFAAVAGLGTALGLQIKKANDDAASP
jgi:hypothetical protein